MSASRYCDETNHYLVIQNVGLGRSKEVEYDTALVAEFEAVVEISTAEVDRKHENRPLKVLSTHLVLRFLGFRNASLSAAPMPP